MSLYHDTAITLRRLDYSESSQVLLMLTHAQGIQRLIAKGIRRSTRTRFAVGIDLLELGDVVYSRREGSASQLGTLTEWRQRELFAHLRSNLPALHAAQYAAEATAHLLHDADPHPGVFAALEAHLRALADQPPGSSLVRFLHTLLRDIGLEPRMDVCVACGNEPRPAERLYLSARAGGLICQDCEPTVLDRHGLSRTAWQRWQDPPPDRQVVSSLFEALNYYLTETIGRPLRLTRFIRTTLFT